MPSRRMPDAPHQPPPYPQGRSGLPQIHGPKPVPLGMGLDAGNQEEAGVAYKDEGRKPSLIASLQPDPYPGLEKRAPLALIYPSREDR
jgi:hypothetical protein